VFQQCSVFRYPSQIHFLLLMLRGDFWLNPLILLKKDSKSASFEQCHIDQIFGPNCCFCSCSFRKSNSLNQHHINLRCFYASKGSAIRISWLQLFSFASSYLMASKTLAICNRCSKWSSNNRFREEKKVREQYNFPLDSEEQR
jgi:hypothetical protein